VFQAIIALRPLTLVMSKMSYEDKAQIVTLRKHGFGYRTNNNSCTISTKRVGLCSVKAICKRVDERGQQLNESKVLAGSGRPKTARTEENVRYLKLLISENRTLTLMPRNFTKY